MEKKEKMGLAEFAESANLSSNLPEYAALTLYMICSFDGWVGAFNTVDEDPLSESEIETIRSAVSTRPVDPLRWNAIVEKLMDDWTSDEEKDLGCVRILEDFSRGIDLEWVSKTSFSVERGTFVKVLSFYMGLYSANALDWVRAYSEKYNIDIPYDMTDRLSAWKKTRYPEIDPALLCKFAREIKKGAISRPNTK